MQFKVKLIYRFMTVFFPCLQVFSLILKHQVAVKLSISCSESRASFLPSPTSQSYPSSCSPESSALNPSFSSSSAINNTQNCYMGGSDSLESALMISDPLHCPILAGRECTIEICKGNLGLGLSIIGGCDTLLVRSANFLCYICFK